MTHTTLHTSTIVARFLRYTQFDTQSNFDSTTSPSTEKQKVLALALVEELHALGVTNAHLGEGGVVYAHLEATPGAEHAPTVGFIAHMDTSPDAPGANVKPQILTVTGEDLVLNAKEGIRFPVSQFPEILDYVGDDVIFTDGTTLLGADDKAGIAAIMTMVERLTQDPMIPHARIAVAFTPDEEIGRGTDHFDLEHFGAQYAYTFDGGAIGELETENFNAGTAVLTIHGVGVHPGYAKDKMVNAVSYAAKFIEALPHDMTPETTEGYEGFIHPNSVTGSVTQAVVQMLIRDHDQDLYVAKKALLRDLVQAFTDRYPEARFSLAIQDSYENMKPYIDRTPKVVDVVRDAFKDAGVTPIERPIRGGTDGARLSTIGLPCPNVFVGGLNFHGIFECLPIKSLEKAGDVATAIAKRSAEIRTLKYAK